MYVARLTLTDKKSSLSIDRGFLSKDRTLVEYVEDACQATSKEELRHLIKSKDYPMSAKIHIEYIEI